MESLLKYVTYFENVARTLNSVLHTDTNKHFACIDSASLFAGVQTEISDVAFFLENYSAGFQDNNGTLSKRPHGAFSLVKQVPQSGSYAEKTDAKIWAEAECMKILAKIRYEQKQGVADVRGFLFNSVEFELLDNMPNGWCGMRVSFEMTANTSLCYDASEFSSDADLVKICKPIEAYSVAELLVAMSETQINGVVSAQNVLLLEDGELIEIE